MEVSGTEVNEDLCTLVKDRLATYECEVDLKVGTNTSLPFDNDSFDYLVSWNTIHYEDNEADIQRAISEYARVLKKGGRFFLSTTGPDHMILKGSETLGGHRYRIGYEDFRKGQVFFYFDSHRYIQSYFSKEFSDVMVGNCRDEIFTKVANFFIVTGIK